MKKSNVVGIVIVAVVLVFSVAPFFVGKSVEKQILATLSEGGSKKLNEYGKLALKQHERGAYSSIYHFSYQLPDSQLSDHEKVEFACDMDHGVIGVDYQCKIENSAYLEWVEQHLVEGENPLELIGSANVFGRIQNTLMIYAAKFKEKEGQSDEVEINILPGEITIESDEQLSFFHLDAELEGIELKFENEKNPIEFKRLTLEGESNSIDYDSIYFGDIQLEIDAIAAPNVSFKNIEFNSRVKESNKSDEAMDMLQSIAIESIELLEENSDFDDFKDLTLNVGIKNMNIAAYADVLEKYREILQSSYSSKLSNSKSNQLLGQAADKLEKILREDLGLSLRVSADTKGSELFYNMDVKLNQDIGFAGIFSYMGQLDQIGEILNVKIDSFIPKKSMDLLQPDMRSQLSIYQSSGKGHKLSFHIDENETVLNGKKTTVSQVIRTFP